MPNINDHQENHVIINMSSCLQEDDHNEVHYQQSEAVPASKTLSILHDSLLPVTLKFEDVAYTVNLSTKPPFCFSSSKPKTTKPVLNGVTGIARPGELLAMLGPSGSGKTTLLTALAGRLPEKISGSLTYNGHPFNSLIKRKTGFVTQDDVLYPHLTVLETLNFCALLRLPKKLSAEEKREQVELIIMELGLSACRNSMVGGGGSLVRGVSGGERKRVSIGQEMLVNPSLLLLDEPTSGLDSTTAQRIVAILRRLAGGGRTVVTTIHQPSSRLFRMFDKVVVLADGCPIYSGYTGGVVEYFDGLGFSCSGFSFMNPADFLLDLANGIVPETRQDNQLENHVRLDQRDRRSSTKQFLMSSYKRNLYPALKAEIQQMDRAYSSSSELSFCRNSDDLWSTIWWLQFKVLLRRGLRERRHESYSSLKIFQVMSVSILSGLLWWHSDTSHIQDQVGLLFFFSIFWGFFPMFTAIFTFPQERPMLIKERSSGMYHLSSYYFARIAGDLPMELVLPTIFVTVTYWMAGLKPSLITFLSTLLIVLFNVLVSQGLGLALGAMLMNLKQATTLSSVMMLLFLLVSGYYIQHIPSFIAWLKYTSFSHYSYKLLVAVQYSSDEVYSCGNGLRCRVMDFPGIKLLGLNNKLWDVTALTIMLVGYRLLAYVALRMRQPH